jgi:hypothetical protein
MRMPPKEAIKKAEHPCFQTTVDRDLGPEQVVPTFGRERSRREIRENWYGKTAMPEGREPTTHGVLSSAGKRSW